MEPVELYFVFHHRPTLQQIWNGEADLLQYLGHVEAMGYTVDGTWFFYDPGRHRSRLLITHLHDEIDTLMQEKFARAQEVIKIKAAQKFPFPLHFPMNCVTQCAALVGMRAFAPGMFRKKLLQSQGVIVHGTEGRSGRQERA